MGVLIFYWLILSDLQVFWWGLGWWCFKNLFLGVGADFSRPVKSISLKGCVQHAPYKMMVIFGFYESKRCMIWGVGLLFKPYAILNKKTPPNTIWGSFVKRVIWKFRWQFQRWRSLFLHWCPHGVLLDEASQTPQSLQ